MLENKILNNLFYLWVPLISVILAVASDKQLICASYGEPITWELEKIRHHIAWPDGTLRVYYKTVAESNQWFNQTLWDSSKLLVLMVEKYPLSMNLSEFLQYSGFLTLSELDALNLCWDAINWVGEPGLSEQEVLARKVACMYSTRLQEASYHLHEVSEAING